MLSKEVSQPLIVISSSAKSMQMWHPSLMVDARLVFRRYVTVDRSSQRQLFYYLVTRETPPNESSQPQDESTTSPDDSPLIIWLTGGPGCSSLDAYTYENGPFIFSAPGKKLPKGVLYLVGT